MNIKKLVELFKTLPKGQLQEIYEKSRDLLHPTPSTVELSKDYLEQKFTNGIMCPHCKSKSIVKFGKYKNTQRYKCKDCSKTFCPYTDTPIFKTRLGNRWLAFLECMVKGMSLRQSSKAIGVHYVTLFYWRHKILDGLKSLSINSFEGIFEVDETYLLYSEKGKRKITNRKPRKRGGASKLRGISHEQVCILVARDRKKNTYAKAVCMGRLNINTLKNHLDNYVTNDNVLCSDAWKSYKTYAKEKGLEHYVLNATEKKYVIKDLYHIQNVNAFHSRLKDWLKRFKGVASKYLNNYLEWFNFVEKYQFEYIQSKRKGMLIQACINNTFDTYYSIRLSQLNL